MSSTLAPLPPAWVERLFLRMAGKYGATWSQKWSGVEEQAKAEWGEGLAGFTAEEIRNGLGSLGVYPPSLPEFIRLCRPSLDPEKAFYEALRQMRLRNQDGSDRWSSPLVYWAAVWMGNDLFSAPYKALRARWEKTLLEIEQQIRGGDLPGTVPSAPKKLPPPPKAEGNWLIRESCVQTFTALMEGRACPVTDPLDDLPWLPKTSQRPKLKDDGTYLVTVSKAGGLLTEIVNNAAKAAESAQEESRLLSEAQGRYQQEEAA